MDSPSKEDSRQEDIQDVTDGPVFSLVDGLPLRKLISDKQIEIEIRPDDDDIDEPEDTNPDAILKLDDWEKYVNLNCLNIEDGNSNSCNGPFETYHQKMHNVREDAKLKKFVVKAGIGPLVPDNSIVYVHYQVYQEYNEIPFDTTIMQNDGKAHLPIAYNLAKRQLLPGLHEAIITMKAGEKSEFLVHHDLAYGKLGCPPRVPAEATVLFVVEVERFVDCGVDFEADNIPNEDRNRFIYVHKTAKGCHNQGNDKFKNEDFRGARRLYQKAINLLLVTRYADEEEERTGSKLLVKLYSNAIICNHKLNCFKRVCSLASDAFRDHIHEASKMYKIKYYWGMAKMNLGDYKSARKLLKDAKSMVPNNEEISKALAQVAKKEQEEIQREKMMYKKMMVNSATVVEVEENTLDPEDEFTKNIKHQLEEFCKSPFRTPILLRIPLTREEEITCLNLAKDLGLYGRIIDSNASRYIEITKSEE